ncbi:interleukin-17 receptor A-like isoform X2 [Brienomyrus brachyistius]|uniref:interleukin-17 receptor A-like isoform X2 n=1 Tax=Brienomyrus brachyistius TaxID=42636 RepID=UPI0020B361A2|nr:interleukin-17 receptor A-like isoform X2 [Brienomyrus brachyistius]
MYILLFCIIIFAKITVTTNLRILEQQNCTQEGLRCSVNITRSNCLDEYWKMPRWFTPTEPVWLCKASARWDEMGHLVPVLMVEWKARRDGSITALKGAEVQVTEADSGQRVCIQYVFHDQIKRMVNPHGESWSFSVDRVAVLPGRTYTVSVSHLPKPDVGYVEENRICTVPGCRDPTLQETKVCVDSGSLWNPNITWDISASPQFTAVVSVAFSAGEFCDKYRVSIHYLGVNQSRTVWKENQPSMNVSFSVGPWRGPCCEVIAIHLVPACVSDLNSIPIPMSFLSKDINYCFQPLLPLQEDQLGKCIGPDVTEFSLGHSLTTLIFGLTLICVLLALLRKNRQKAPYLEENSLEDSGHYSSVPAEPCRYSEVKNKRKVLVIYSLDHTLYKDIVLKLSAFLRAKCGTDVVLDMLDTAELGTVGRMQWLDSQKQQMEKSSDKILILCSQGVQAKWNAMCGGRRVMLKEDVRSPNGDMLTPAFSLIIPDLLHPDAIGKYIVAYFDDISSEDDVPSPFNITVKYKLMKHFEELYFRILDKEKYEPGKVNRIEGIAQDEYFSCPSGRALRDAIEAFQAYQLEHPDWFEMECVDSEEDALDTDLQCPLLVETQNSSVLQCVPDCKEGPPVFFNTVDVNEESGSIFQLTPLIENGKGNVFSQHVDPVANSAGNQVWSAYSAAQLDDSSVHPMPSAVQPQQSQVYSVKSAGQVEKSPLCSVYAAVEDIQRLYTGSIHPTLCSNVAMQELAPPALTWDQEIRETEHLHVEDHEGELVSRCLSADVRQKLMALQQSLLGSRTSQVPSSVEEKFPYGQEAAGDYAWNKSPSGSDQGYISRTSPQQDSPLRGDLRDHLGALSRLQDTNLSHSIKPLSHPDGSLGNSGDHKR